MNELRWILVAFGVVLLTGIYLWGRRSAKQSAAAEDVTLRLRPEPQFSEGPAASSFTMDEADPDVVEEQQYRAAAIRAADFADTEIRSVAAEEEVAPEALPRSAATSYKAISRDVRRDRIEPTLDSDAPTDDVHNVTAELPVNDAASDRHPHQDAPTLSMSDTPQPKRVEHRKIVALRLAAGSQRFPGVQLRQALEAEDLQHGKYEVFHRLHGDGGNVFSIASMVEPGTFDLEKMDSLSYPGVTLFAQLPGPVPGAEALNELVACGKRLQSQLGGTLQDERGVPLTVHRTERLRQEVREFETPGRRDGGRDPAHRGAYT